MALGDNSNRRPYGRRSQNLVLFHDDLKRLIQKNENKENDGPQREEKSRAQISPKSRSGNRQSLGGKGQKPSPEKIKTALCDNLIKNGSCDFGENCWFAHGEGELRASSKTKTFLHKNRKKNNNRRSTFGKQEREAKHSQEAIPEEPVPTKDVEFKVKPEAEGQPSEVQETIPQEEHKNLTSDQPFSAYPPPPTNVITRFTFETAIPEDYPKWQATIEKHARHSEKLMQWILSVWDAPPSK
ncbi:hypothetical protein L596_029228 [Steinernema carpocapsae]|uniref:C3H1-type domain-containing protein n=1 Tax=Steinernema carpocapsae TaxID=34508 RepID=A0A4U5LU12_STECR|nr:hypothetical protein L596_029228 [Steinernema carpocapsae]